MSSCRQIVLEGVRGVPGRTTAPDFTWMVFWRLSHDTPQVLCMQKAETPCRPWPSDHRTACRRHCDGHAPRHTPLRRPSNATWATSPQYLMYIVGRCNPTLLRRPLPDRRAPARCLRCGGGGRIQPHPRPRGTARPPSTARQPAAPRKLSGSQPSPSTNTPGRGKEHDVYSRRSANQHVGKGKRI